MTRHKHQNSQWLEIQHGGRRAAASMPPSFPLQAEQFCQQPHSTVTGRSGSCGKSLNLTQFIDFSPLAAGTGHWTLGSKQLSLIRPDCPWGHGLPGSLKEIFSVDLKFFQDSNWRVFCRQPSCSRRLAVDADQEAALVTWHRSCAIPLTEYGGP